MMRFVAPVALRRPAGRMTLQMNIYRAPIVTCLVTLVLAAVLVAGCRRPQPPASWQPTDFDGQRALRHVERQVAFGPRPSGSAALAQTADYILAQLAAAGLQTEQQIFRAVTPRGEIEFRNVIGRTARAATPPLIIIGAHYDTKRLDPIPFVGANDAGSGVGVLLEMARVAASEPNLWFVCFDGEEAELEYGPGDGLWGSRYFAERLATASAPPVRAFILLDMVGDADLTITIPRNCSAELVEQVFAASRALGYRDHFRYRPADVLDDHVPFLLRGIPAVNLIDFEYGSAPGQNDYWHTAQDTLDKVSARSLQIVGRTALQLIRQLRTAR